MGAAIEDGTADLSVIKGGITGPIIRFEVKPARGEPIEDPGNAVQSQMEGFLSEQSQVVRHLRTAGAPGSGQLRKEAIIAGYRAVFAALGPIPDWFYELERRVGAGEI